MHILVLTCLGSAKQIWQFILTQHVDLCGSSRPETFQNTVSGTTGAFTCPDSASKVATVKQ